MLLQVETGNCLGLLSDKHDLYLLLAKFLGEQYDKVGTLHKK